MASGWNLWVWLECIGLVSGCCCKEVYRYPHNNYYFSYSTCISSIFGSSIPTSLFKCPETSTCEAPRDVSRKLQETLCAIMAS